MVLDPDDHRFIGVEWSRGETMRICIGTAKGIVILDPARGSTPLMVLADPSPGPHWRTAGVRRHCLLVIPSLGCEVGASPMTTPSLSKRFFNIKSGTALDLLHGHSPLSCGTSSKFNSSPVSYLFSSI